MTTAGNWADAISALDLGAERDPVWTCATCHAECGYYLTDDICDTCREAEEERDCEHRPSVSE